jgi:hypothetical protein
MENHAAEIQPESASSSPAAAPTSPAITTTVAPTEIAAPTVPKHQPDETTAPPATDPAGTTETSQTAPAPKTQPKRTTSQLLELPPTEREQAGDQDQIAEDTVLLAYQLVLHGGREEVVRVKSQLILPMALALENLPLTESSFPELVDRVLVQPLNTKFRAFLQRLFDAASRAAVEKEAAAAVEPLFQRPVSVNAKPSKPTNGASFTMPEIDAKPPLPTRPGSIMWSGS